jgi:hypothetical protein
MASPLNGMTLLAVSPEFKFIARGAVLSRRFGWMFALGDNDILRSFIAATLDV